jgi:TolB-like protein/class 3 adenylate cyclase/tetratricopeptide (TPR) repeat protein
VAQERVERRLAAILVADVVGYSRLVGMDEEGTIARLKTLREELIDPGIAKHQGRIFKTTGDGVLAEFPSVVDAVRSAAAVQRELKEREADVPEDRRIAIRVGINLGDIVIDGDDILGDGVNVAARLEGLAEPGGICVSGTVMEHVAGKLDLGFEDMGEQQVKNIAKPVRVYRVLMEPDAAGTVLSKKPRRPKSWQWVSAAAVIAIAVTAVWWQPWVERIEPASVERMAFPLPDKPSIAVLPFDNLSGDPEQDFLGDGITENIIASLSKISQILVIARNSTFTYKGKPVKVQRVAEDLGVRYVLEGSVQKSGDKLRVTAQLVDAVKGHHLWSERYDRGMADLFAVQDDITREIVVALHVKFTEGEEARVRHRWTNNLQAWENAVRAYALFERFTKEDNARARALFEQAVELDPKYSWASAKTAFTHLIDARFSFTEDRAASFAKALEIAQQTLEMEDEIADAHILLSLIRLTQRRHDESLVAGRKAIALDPNYPQARAALAHTTRDLGQWDETIALANSAARLHPHHPAWYFLSPSTAYVFKGEYDLAVAAAEEGVRRAESDYLKGVFYRQMAFAHMEAGREEEARRDMAEGQRLNTSSAAWYRNYFRFKNPAHLEQMLAALHKAGLPE